MSRLLLAFALLAAISGLAAGDGGYFPPNHFAEDIFEPTQKAVILTSEGQEKLILEVSYRGNASDFAWVVPSPGYPEVSMASSMIFVELNQLTKPRYVRALVGLENLGNTKAMSQAEVTLHETKQVGIYEVAVLSANDPGALIGWLNQNNYSTSEKAKEAIGYYTGKKWYFTALRINLNPNKERLLASLRRIEPNITDEDSAIELLGERLGDDMRRGIAYQQQPLIRQAQLDFGEVDEAAPMQGGYYATMGQRHLTERPDLLFTEEEYNGILEDYSGFLPGHMKTHVLSYVGDGLRSRAQLPTRYGCFAGVTQENAEYCSLWYFDDGDDEVVFLKSIGANPLKTKGGYFLGELAKSAAEFAADKDVRVIAYFGLSSQKPHWYSNRQDMVRYYARDIEMRLEQARSREVDAARAKLEGAVVGDVAGRLGIELAGMDSAVEALTDRTLEDIWVGKSYSESSVGKLGCFQSYGYERLMRYYNGDRDDVRLNQRLRDHISSKVRWTDMQTQSRLGQGTIQPVMLSFPTNETVYPLKISSVNKGQSEILIYVFGKHKASADGFSIEYADWVGIDDVRGRKYLGELLDDRYFLTKMRRAMWPNEMKEDVIIGDAVNDLSELPVDYEAGFSTKWALYIAALAAAYVAISIINLPLAVVLNILSKMTARTRLGVKPMLYPIYALPLPVMLFIVSLLGQLTDSSIPYKVANLPVALSYQLMHLFGMPSWASWVLMFAVASLASFALVHALITLAGHWWAKRGPRNATVA